MDINTYQEYALQTALKKGESFSERDMLRFTLGLSDEAGEVAGAVKKYLRGDFPLDQLQERLQAELGDVAWYFVVLCASLGINPAQVLHDNVEKLSDRQDRGVIQGDGDNR